MLFRSEKDGRKRPKLESQRLLFRAVMELASLSEHVKEGACHYLLGDGPAGTGKLGVVPGRTRIDPRSLSPPLPQKLRARCLLPQAGNDRAPSPAVLSPALHRIQRHRQQLPLIHFSERVPGPHAVPYVVRNGASATRGILRSTICICIGKGVA